MKIKLFIALWILVLFGCLCVQAADTAAQAAARAALEQKLNELDAAPAPPAALVAPVAIAPPVAAITLPPPTSPAPSANTWDVVAIPAEPTNNLADAPPENKLPSPTITDAPSQSQPVTAPASAPVFVKPPNDIVTIYGTVYRNAQVEKVEQDDVLISYWTASGGFAISKVDLNVLPADFLSKWSN